LDKADLDTIKGMDELEKEIYENLKSNHQPFYEEERLDGDYGMWTIFLYNLKVMSSFLAEYDPTTFYLTVTLFVGGIFTTIFRVYTFQAW